MQKIMVLVYHSLAELDVLFPIFTQLKSEDHKIEIEMVITKELIYSQMMKNKIYVECIRSNKIKVKKIFRKDLFDRRRIKKNIFLRVINRLYLYIIEPYYLVKHIKPLITSNIYMHEYTKNMYQVYMMYLMQKLINRKILIYNHAASLNFNTTVMQSVNQIGKFTLLSFHVDSNETFRKMGYKDIVVIGHPKFFPAWKEFIKRMSIENSDEEKYILIYSRNIHEDCMDPDIYEKLHLSTYKIVRNFFAEKKILIKPHPKEDIAILKSIILKSGIQNIEISTEQSMILASNAKVAIVFYSSTILDALAMNIPSVEYYIESKNFRKTEPKGSVYKNIGIESVSSEKELEVFLTKVLEKIYKRPYFINYLMEHNNLKIFSDNHLKRER